MKLPIPYSSGKLPLKKGYSTFIALFDMHYPHTVYFDALLQVLTDAKPDYLILGGDIINNDPFNHWAKKKPKLTKVMPQPHAYYELANRDLFKPIREAVGRKTNIIYILGNHEDWSNKAVDMIPEGEGYFEVERNIDYVDSFVKNKNMVALGDLWFSHGDTTPFGKNNHARKVVERLHRNVVFGHYHDYEAYSLSVPVDEKPLMGVSVPCLTDTNPCSYGGDMPNNRSHGFAEGAVRSDGRFDLTVIHIKEGEFTYHGKRYKSKQTKPREYPYSL